MKQFLSSIALALTLSLSVFSVQAKPSSPDYWNYLQPDREQVIASLNVVELLRRHHYNKPPLNDERSRKIYQNYLKLLDPSRSYFLASDIAEFDRWSEQFDDFLKSGELQPGFIMYKRHLVRLQGRLEFAIGQIEAMDKIDFNVDESLQVDRENAAWPKNQAELDNLWRKRIKDEVLRQKIAGRDDKAIAEQLGKRYRSQLTRLEQTRGEDVFESYINAFTQTYDPHTTYMSPENAENFDINMSLSLEGIGAVLQGDNEYVKVVRLIPAGPAEKSKSIAPADKIIGVAQGKREMVDVIGWRLNEVVQLVRGPKGSVVRLEVIPASNAPNDMSSKVVSITREKIKLEEQAAKKSILNLDSDGTVRKVGVIEIPMFYQDFQAANAGAKDYTSTTRDVKRLITELKKENVDGIVIDLRNNGGGSLQEATELTGLFIDQGPTVLVRSSDGRVDVLGDDVPGVHYSGPLVVLINRLSASASEIFAGAMQDYHRALILGDQTFGKGTVQQLQELNHGKLKLTLAKFYRVSGQSTQHRGVLPDIAFPSMVDTTEIGESALPDALPWDSISPAISPERDPFKSHVPELTTRHEQRIASDPDFVFSRKRLALAQELMKDTLLTLNEEKRRQQQVDIEARQLALENQRRKAKGQELLAALEKVDENALPSDEDEKSPEDDAYLAETGKILLDYLSIKGVLASH